MLAGVSSTCQVELREGARQRRYAADGVPRQALPRAGAFRTRSWGALPTASRRASKWHGLSNAHQHLQARQRLQAVNHAELVVPQVQVQQVGQHVQPLNLPDPVPSR